MIDRKAEFDYGIGESMLEIFWDYAARDLKLGRYLDCNHLPKHGLRFFFDHPEKNLAIGEMSEMGRTWNDSIPAHQIDRRRFDRFLSAVHFMYPGYWFWMIPLDQDVCSIGVVWRHDKAPQIDIKGQDDFIAFMREHRALDQVLGRRSEVVDYGGMKNMSPMADQFSSTDRSSCSTWG